MRRIPTLCKSLNLAKFNEAFHYTIFLMIKLTGIDNRRMMKNIAVCSFLFYANYSFGQVELFEPNLISNNQEFGMTISPDGKHLLFVRAFGGRDSLRIFQSQKINGKWQKPQAAFFSSKGVNQIDPSFSPDGAMILINSIKKDRQDYDVFVIKKTSSDWAKLERLSDAINTEASEFYATMSNNKNIYFTRRLESNDIYVSQWKNNKYQKAIPLSHNINSDKSESNPYVSADEAFIIYTSELSKGYGGVDLYISFNKEGKWSFPQNLGNKVNTDLNEFCPNIDIKNKRFLFSRTLKEGDKRTENIYSIPLKELKLKQLKKNAKWNE